MQQIKLGIIGCGGIAKTHVNNILAGKCPSVRVTALSNRTAQKAHKIAEMLAERGVQVAVFESGSAMIQQADIDAVLICTPHYQHADYTVEAFQKGLHVLCEKPAGVYTLQAKRMNKAADLAKNKVFGMMFNQRTNPVNIKIHDMLENGELGKIRRINWINTDSYRGQDYFDAEKWRGTWKSDGGGVLMNQAPHRLDLLQWFFGMPKQVTAFIGMGRWHDVEVDDDVTAYMEFPNGATGVFIASTSDAPGTNRLEITGENGKLVCEDNKLVFYRLQTGLGENPKHSNLSVIKEDIIVDEVESGDVARSAVLEAFAGAILKGTPQIADGREGYNSLVLANAMLMSHWKGQTIKFPFDEEEYLHLLEEHF